jgi:hypothetical protein
MGIRFTCPNGHKLHVKAFLAGKRGVCPQCGAKILIPTEEESQQQVAPAPPQFEPIGPVKASMPMTGTLTETGSPSIIIAVADPSFAKTPIVDTPVSVSPTVVSTLPPPIQTVTAPPTIPEPPTLVQPILVAEAVEPISPAVRYVAQRERNRRNQFVFAVLLLLAVVVLAGVLVFVLQRGASQTPVKSAPSTSRYELLPSRQLAVLSDHGFNAHSAQVAN